MQKFPQLVHIGLFRQFHRVEEVALKCLIFLWRRDVISNNRKYYGDMMMIIIKITIVFWLFIEKVELLEKVLHSFNERTDLVKCLEKNLVLRNYYI